MSQDILDTMKIVDSYLIPIFAIISKPKTMLREKWYVVPSRIKQVANFWAFEKPMAN